MSVTIGVDAGLQGGIAVFLDGTLTELYDMPVQNVKVGKKIRQEIDIEEFRYVLRRVTELGLGGHAVVIEQQSTRPGQSAQSGLKTGTGFGLLVGVCVGMHLPSTIVRPQKWKKHFGLTGDNSTKLKSVELAEKLWPHHVFRGPLGGLRDGRAEAALIGKHHMETQ